MSEPLAPVTVDFPAQPVGLPLAPDGIEQVPGFLRVGDRGFIVNRIRTTQTDEGLQVHVCASAALPDSPGAEAMLAERVAACAPLRVGASLPFGAERVVRCEKIEVTTGDVAHGESLCADFADPMLSMTRSEDRAMWRESVRGALQIQPAIRRHLDEGGGV